MSTHNNRAKLKTQWHITKSGKVAIVQVAGVHVTKVVWLATINKIDVEKEKVPLRFSQVVTVVWGLMRYGLGLLGFSVVWKWANYSPKCHLKTKDFQPWAPQTTTAEMVDGAIIADGCQNRNAILLWSRHNRFLITMGGICWNRC